MASPFPDHCLYLLEEIVLDVLYNPCCTCEAGSTFIVSIQSLAHTTCQIGWKLVAIS